MDAWLRFKFIGLVGMFKSVVYTYEPTRYSSVLFHWPHFFPIPASFTEFSEPMYFYELMTARRPVDLGSDYNPSVHGGRAKDSKERFGGVVGYRICLTHRRSPVRARAESFFQPDCSPRCLI